MFESLFSALEYTLKPEFWIAFFIALALATAVGLIPGVGSTLTMAVALPIIIVSVDDPVIGILMLAVITGTSNTFDSIPAQLMGVVSSGTQVTFLEGHKLARKGQGAYSLGAVYAVSAIGGLVGAFCLLLAIPFIRPLVLSMSFGEIAMLALFGIMMVAVLSRGAILKGLASGLLGLLAATVGLQSYSGTERFTFGSFDLKFGLPLVAVAIAFMAIPEIIDLAITRAPVAPKDADVSTAAVFRGFRTGLSKWKLAVRHSLIGVSLGAIPGSSGSVVTWISYAIGVGFAKDKREFGKGSLDGLLFAESSENAKEGGQAIPTLALGIPGTASWALVIVAMISYGITPGPNMLDKHADIVGIIVFSFALANLVLTILALFITRQLMRVTMTPYPVIAGVVLPVMILGAYFDSRHFVVFPLMVAFATLGILMKKYGWPRPPFLLAFILGPTIEENLHDAISIHGPLATVTRPLTIVLFLVSVATVVFIYRAMDRSDKAVADLGLPPKDIEALELADDPDEPIMLGDNVSGTGAAAPTTATAEATRTEAPRARFALYWRNEHLFAIMLVCIGLAATITALGWTRLAAQIVPVGAGVGVVVLCSIQLVRQATSPTEVRGQIMDMDVRSAGMADAPKAAMKMAIILSAFAICLILFGLQWSALFLGAAIPIVFADGRKKVLASAVSLILIWLFMFVVGDELLAVLWPTGIIRF